MSTPAEKVVLNEVDAELTLLGSLFGEPGAFETWAAEINAEWFSDQFLRYLFEAGEGIIAAGHKLSGQAIVAMMPEDCGGITRTNLYAAAMAAALPLSMVGGVLATIKDRWARRSLADAAYHLNLASTRFDADPYEVAADTVLALDTINASRQTRKDSGTIQTAAASLMASLDQPAALRGAPTGLRALDKALNGYKAGQLYVIAGRPGMGKSAFMVSSLRRTAAAGYGVGIFSLEMTSEEIAARSIADALDHLKAPHFGAILKGLLSDEEKAECAKVIEALDAIPMHIDASPRLTFSEITARARRLKATLEAEGRFLSVLCIDHMGLVTPSDRYRGNKVAEAGEVSGMARALAKELDCCVILLCQLSREVEKRDDKKPVMADLRWSGEIEQDAHVVAFLYREAYYLAQDANADPVMLQQAKHRLDFLIRKNRNGETVDIELWCSIAHSCVRDE
jgi:replicative DNA helicase